MLRRVLLVLALAYVGVCVAVWFLQERMVFLPSRERGADPSALGLAFEELRIDTAEGESIHCWWVPHAEAHWTVVFCHGNAGNIHHRLDTVRSLHALGVSVFIFDYPGYGASTGRPTEESCVRAALAAVRSARDLDGAGHVVLWGRSLGGGVAAAAAALAHPAALVLESTFTSVPDLAGEIYPFLPTRLLARVRLDSREVLSRLDLPVLVIHGRDDEVVPFRHGELLHAAARGSRFLALRGGHDDAFLTDRSVYQEGTSAFLSSLASPDPLSDAPGPAR